MHKMAHEIQLLWIYTAEIIQNLFAKFDGEDVFILTPDTYM